MNRFIRLSLLFLIGFPINQSFAKEIDKIHISKYSNTIGYDSLNRIFYSSYTIKGYSLAKGVTYSVYFNDLSRLENLTVKFINSKGKSLKLNAKEFYDVVQTDNSYYSGIKNKSFVIPYEESANNQFEISYKLVTTNKWLFNELHFYTQYPTDTISYVIKTNSKFRFIFNKLDFNKTKGIALDSTNSNSYNFTKHNTKNILNQINKLNYIQNYSLFESIRFYFKGLDENNDGYLTFSKWYNNLINDFELDKFPEIKTEFNTITKSSSNKDSIVKYTLEYVKNTIRYIAIEDGINAYKPRTPFQVLKNKKGDCKDMAYLIMHILRMNKIESYVALISSNNSKYDFNFPSLSSANHAICIAKINNKWMVLDATDPSIPYPLISRHTQGKTAFIVKEDSYEFYKIPMVKPELNTVNLQQKIYLTDTGIYNNYIYKFKGYRISDFVQINDEKDKKKRLFNTEVALENTTSNMYYFDTKLTNYDSTIIIEGKSQLSNSLINYSTNKLFIGIDFIPFPINFNYKIDSNETVLIQETTNIELESSINSKTKMKLTNPKKFEYNSSPFKFKLIISQPNDYKILLNYQFTVNDIYIDFNDFKNYQQFCNELKKAKNYVLTIQ